MVSRHLRVAVVGAALALLGLGASASAAPIAALAPGSTVTITLTGPSGTNATVPSYVQTAQATVQPDGTFSVDFPIRSYGHYEVSVEGSTADRPMVGKIDVDRAPQPCGSQQAPGAVCVGVTHKPLAGSTQPSQVNVRGTIPATGASTSRPTEAVPAAPPAAAPPQPAATTAAGGGGMQWFPWLALVIAGLGVVGAGGLLVRRGGAPSTTGEVEQPQLPPYEVFAPAASAPEEFDTLRTRQQMLNLVRVRRERGDKFDDSIGLLDDVVKDEDPPDPSKPIILPNKGKLYNDLIVDRASVQAIIKQEKATWLGMIGRSVTLHYAEKVLVRIEGEIKDFEEREKLHGTVGAANLLWDERQQQWNTYKWAIWNSFALPVSAAFGGLAASGGGVVKMIAQIFTNVSQTPDEVVEWVTGKDPSKTGGVPIRQVLGIFGSGFNLYGGTKSAFGNLPKPPKTQLNLPGPKVNVPPPPPGLGKPWISKVAPVPPPQPKPWAPKVAPVPAPMGAAYNAEHNALNNQLKSGMATMNQANQGTHWYNKRGVNCPYTSLAFDQWMAGTPMAGGAPPFTHTDGLGLLETHYGNKFKPITPQGLKAALQNNPGGRGVVYVAWPKPPNWPPGRPWVPSAHVFNAVSIQGKEGTHVFLVDAQTGQVDPLHLQNADPKSIMFMPTK
jgi:hypothetical protein